MGLKLKKKDTEREYRKFFQGWLPKMTERLSVILYNVRDHSDLKEDDWEVIKTAYRWYHMGYLPQFEPEVSSPIGQKAIQPDLFADGLADGTPENSVGTKVAESTAETKEEESDETTEVPDNK